MQSNSKSLHEAAAVAGGPLRQGADSPVHSAVSTSQVPSAASEQAERPVVGAVSTEQEPLSAELLAVFGKGRPLAYPLEVYWRAPGSGPLHATWIDKPHRVVYDLVAALVAIRNSEQQRIQSHVSGDVTGRGLTSEAAEGAPGMGDGQVQKKDGAS